MLYVDDNIRSGCPAGSPCRGLVFVDDDVAASVDGLGCAVRLLGALVVKEVMAVLSSCGTVTS
jgi:hypothetical protein